MAFEFKNLSEVEVQDTPTENTTVMAFEGGVPKQIPAGKFGGGAVFVKINAEDVATDGDGNVVFVGEPYDGLTCFVVDTINYDYIYEALLKGRLVYLQLSSDAKDKLGWVALPNEAVVLYSLEAQGLLAICYDVCMYFTNGSYHTTT